MKNSAGPFLRASVALPIALAVATVFSSGLAAADITKDQCIDANTQAQNLRREGKLTAARGQLQRCGDPACPTIVRDDCSRRTDELEKAQPTILFDAKDSAGHDLVAVGVTVDGVPLVGALDGTALKVDPGPRNFTFTAAGLPTVTQTFVLKEGEKERRERIVFGGAPAPAVPGGVPDSSTGLPSNPLEPTAHGPRGTKVMGLVLGGVGVASVAVGTVFGLLTVSASNRQNTDCASATSCASYKDAASDHSTARTDGAISTVGFIAGGALLAGGAILFLLSGTPSSEKITSSRVVVMPGAAPGAGVLWLRGEF